MKVVILAGGLGTRIAEESHLRPKPMIEIGGYPILWHIMKLFSYYGFDDFIICVGYRGYMIKEYFANYIMHNADLTVDMTTGEIEYRSYHRESWRVTLVDTGTETMTGGRMRRIRKYLTTGEPFFCTYGDGVADIDLRKLADFHLAHGKQATVTAVTPPGRYGALDMDGAEVRRFVEKPPGDQGTINGGFFVLQPEVLDRIDGDSVPFEAAPLEGLARDRQLTAFRHAGFWAAMDTMRDKNYLETLWSNNHAPWRIWSD
jgi:glucose-1-phosphate cytidylyltransferase